MGYRQFKNNASSLLASGIAAGDLLLNVTTGEGALFPSISGSQYFYCTLESGSAIEIVKVTARATDQFTIVRAQEGTSASAFSAGATVELRLTAKEMDALMFLEKLAKSANYTAVAADHGQLIAATGTWTLTLTAAATLADGWAVMVRNVGAGVITVDPNGAETIDGVSTIKLYPGENCLIVCDGSNFFTLRESRRSNVLAKTATYTVVTADHGKVIDATSGTWDLVLTAAATLGDGFWFALRNTGSGAITINPDGSETIDGAATLALAQNDECIVVCDGANFKTIARYIAAGGAAAATQAEMEAASSTSVYASPGRTHFHPGVAKAWVKAGVSANIIASYGVSSLTDTGTGQVTVNLTTAFSTAHYEILATAQHTSSVARICTVNESSAPTTTSFIINCWDIASALADPTYYHIEAKGDQ